jgi:hypothetical protein
MVKETGARKGSYETPRLIKIANLLNITQRWQCSAVDDDHSHQNGHGHSSHGNGHGYGHC